MPANGRSCGKCDYAGSIVRKGCDDLFIEQLPCKLHPTIVMKEPDSWCGQFKRNQEKVERKHESKGTYGLLQNVRLTDEEHSKLMDRFGSKVGERINNLSTYIASKGDKYKSHYATILQWAERDQPVQQGPIY